MDETEFRDKFRQRASASPESEGPGEAHSDPPSARIPAAWRRPGVYIEINVSPALKRAAAELNPSIGEMMRRSMGAEVAPRVMPMLLRWRTKAGKDRTIKVLHCTEHHSPHEMISKAMLETVVSDGDGYELVSELIDAKGESAFVVSASKTVEVRILETKLTRNDANHYTVRIAVSPVGRIS